MVVVVILDIHAADSTAVHIANQSTLVPMLSPQPDKVKLVMVVDDSVTVRKVTTRFLKRKVLMLLLPKMKWYR